MSVARAGTTLARATRFLGAGLRTPDGTAPRPIDGINRAKVIGNGLRELDRFLNLLIDEVAAAAPPPGFDLARFRRQRNTANKLRSLRTARRLPCADHAPLRAIGRSRDCLFHCGGIVRAADGMPAGWPASARRHARGTALAIDSADLAAVCALYDRIARELVSDAAAYAPAATLYLDAI